MLRNIQSSLDSLITIERHIAEQQHNFPEASGTFTAMLQDMAMAGKLIARETTVAGLTDVLGKADTTNIHGEQQQRLDLLADQIIYQINDKADRVCAMASEEHEEILDSGTQYGEGSYVLLYDPLDGSSNIDVNVSVGTIFSIHRKFTHGKRGTLEDVLQEGKRLVAAGYIAYGSSTMMVYATGAGVNGFTLDPTVGEFLLTHPNMTIPEKPAYYSINYGKINDWTPGVRKAVEWLQGDDKADNPDLSMRYVGTLAGDFHRNLLKGGIYMYPGNRKDTRGKIRLMYEAQAVAFIAKQAGGYATDGIGDILHIQPHDLHQTLPLYIGNRDLTKRVETIIQEHDGEALATYRKYRERKPTFE